MKTKPKDERTAILNLYDQIKRQAVRAGNSEIVAHAIAVEVIKRAFPDVDVSEIVASITVKG